MIHSYPFPLNSRKISKRLETYIWYKNLSMSPSKPALNLSILFFFFFFKFSGKASLYTETDIKLLAIEVQIHKNSPPTTHHHSLFKSPFIQYNNAYGHS